MQPSCLSRNVWYISGPCSIGTVWVMTKDGSIWPSPMRRMGQTHVNRWTDDLLRRIGEGQIDPSFVITHTVPIEQGPEMYQTFRDKKDGCIKVVLKP